MDNPLYSTFVIVIFALIFILGILFLIKQLKNKWYWFISVYWVLIIVSTIFVIKILKHE